MAAVTGVAQGSDRLKWWLDFRANFHTPSPTFVAYLGRPQDARCAGGHPWLRSQGQLYHLPGLRRGDLSGGGGIRWLPYDEFLRHRQSKRLLAIMETTAAAHSTSRSNAAPGRWMLNLVRHGEPLARMAASRAIVGRNRSRTDPRAGRFTRHDVDVVVRDAFDRFERLIPDLPGEPTVSSRQNVVLAALTLSLMEALEQAGIERGYVIELTSDTCWRFYRQWGRTTATFTKLMSRDPTRRLRLSVNVFLTYPFGRPGYRFDDVVEENGRSLDMRRCPVADFLGQRDAADLCAGSWCNLDYALAEMWGARLERTSTLVAGASHCDFRFLSAAGVRGRRG